MKVLIVEDQPQHLAEAVKVFRSAGFEVVTAENAQDACSLIGDSWDSPKFDGVVTDLFMPHLAPNAFQKEKGSSEYPCGLIVAATARANKTPFVICTAGYHHGKRYNWITGLVRKLDWGMMGEMVDSTSDIYSDAPQKNWIGALEQLQSVFPKKPEV